MHDTIATSITSSVMPQANVDIAIIGSGFGGSVAALRAAKAGLTTIVLERGRRPKHNATAPAGDWQLSEFTNGPAQIHQMPGLLALSGNALGGGSQIYTAVKMTPKPDIFNSGWPEAFSWDSMQPWFERVRSVIEPRTIEATPHRLRQLEQAALAVGGHVERLPLAWTPPANGDVASVAPSLNIAAQWRAWQHGGGKRPLTQTYLPNAEAAGAEIHCECEVTFIERRNHGYRVHFRRRVDAALFDETINTSMVVIAAGTLNTLRLLFRSRTDSDGLPQLSPALGQQFFTNGDLGAALWGGRHLPVNDNGPLVTGWIDVWERERLFLMESGRFPIANAGPKAPWLFGIMGDPPMQGRIESFSRGMRHQFTQPDARDFHRRASALMKRAADALGTRRLVVPSALFNRRPVTVHPLGGARMANSIQEGVVDHRQAVFGYPGLFVLDGAAIPRQLGSPPSLTIAACAERAMALMLKDG